MKGMILEKYKKVIVLLLLSVAVILCGCEERANLKTIPIETPVWETISTNDIVYPEEESLGDIPLDQLVSACLSGDESWAEACDDELYHRFVEAPFTVCSYISLIQDDEKIERVCDGISVAEVCWGLDQEIEDIISNMREFSLSSAEAHTVSILEASNPVPTPLLGHRCRSSQEITGSPTPFSTSNHYLWICESASFSLSNPNIAA